MAYEITRWIHVLAAITALGANLTYGVWLRRASDNPEVLPFTLRTVKLIDGRVANPAYVLLLLSGLLMAWLADLSLTTPWLLASLILYVLLALAGIFLYAPAFRRQIDLAEQEGLQDEAYQRTARRTTILGVVVTALAVVIVFMMVVKPPLWA